VIFSTLSLHRKKNSVCHPERTGPRAHFSSGVVSEGPAFVFKSLLVLSALLTPGLIYAQSTPTAITNGKLLTVSHGTIENGTIVLSGGKISAIGATGSVTIPSGAQIVDAKGLTVYPGLIEPESNFGLTEISADDNNNDLIERSDEIMPHMHVYDAFHAETELIPVARLNGITNAVVAPPVKTPSPARTSSSSSTVVTATR
jgi:hypothetical protein